MRRVVTLLLSLVAFGCAVRPAMVLSPGYTEPPKALQRVVRLMVEDKDGHDYAGHGFAVGLQLYTVSHLVATAHIIRWQTEDEQLTGIADILWRDDKADLAVLTTGTVVPSLDWAHRLPLLGERVWYVAFEDTDQPTAVPWDGAYRGLSGPGKALLIDGGGYVGISGGPAVLADGSVVGMMTKLGHTSTTRAEAVAQGLQGHDWLQFFANCRPVAFAVPLYEAPKRPQG